MRKPNALELIRTHKNLSTLLEVMLNNPTSEYNLESVAAGFLELSYCNSTLVDDGKAETYVSEMVERAKLIWELVQGTLIDETVGYTKSSPIYNLMEELYKNSLDGTFAKLGKHSSTDGISEWQEENYNEKLEIAYVATSNYIKSIVGTTQTARCLDRLNRKNKSNKNTWELIPDSSMHQVVKYYNRLEQTPNIGLRESAKPVFVECLLTYNTNSLPTDLEDKQIPDDFLSSAYYKTKSKLSQ